MHNHILICLCLLFVSCTEKNNHSFAKDNGFKVNTIPEEVGIDSERLKRVDSICHFWTANGILPHAAAMIVRHGQIVFHQAYGWRDIDQKIKLQKDDIFRMASSTKAITSVALMTLYEQGYFFLDDPISNFIPEFKNPQVLSHISQDGLTYETHPAARELTFRDLLTHRAGMGYGTLWGHPTYRLCEQAGIPNISSKDSITIAEAVKRYATIPLEKEPGESWGYGWNIDVIGYLIELISGMPLDQYFSKVIFEPLGMKDTHFFLPEDKKDRLVTLYTKPGSNSEIVKSDNEFYQTYPVSGAKTYFSGGGGLSGTIEDYAKFCQMLLNGGTFNGKRILGRKTVELIIKNQLGNGDQGFGWGLGFEIAGKNKELETLASAGSYSWSGMFKTFYLCDPKEDMAILLYWNGIDYDDPGIFEKFKIIVYQSLM